MWRWLTIRSCECYCHVYQAEQHAPRPWIRYLADVDRRQRGEEAGAQPVDPDRADIPRESDRHRVEIIIKDFLLLPTLSADGRQRLAFARYPPSLLRCSLVRRYVGC